MAQQILVDHTHLGRTVTGLERITLELFASQSLAPLTLTPVNGGSTAKLMFQQQVALTARLLFDRQVRLLCPGFPPSIPVVMAGGARVIPYIHDCFLITRPQDLNWRAARYMAPAFRYALAHLPWFLVNSEATRAELARFCKPTAEISLYRPVVRDVFGVRDMARASSRSWQAGQRLELIAVGTIEPRKNLAAAAAIVGALRATHGHDAVLHLIGRPGWGGEAERLATMPGVIVHGYQSAEEIRARLTAAHVFISTSHDEGLGLPLLEAQYAGLPVVAPDKPVFREVLGDSGLFVNPSDIAAAAAAIDAMVRRPGVFAAAAAAAEDNIARWNGNADADRQALVERLQRS